jgi:hypothetical protein
MLIRAVLREYLTRGFALNDGLLKKAGGGHYRRKLLERNREPFQN